MRQGNGLLLAASFLYLAVGFLVGQALFHRGSVDKQALVLAVLAVTLAISFSWVWLEGNDEVFQSERRLWLMVPWVLVLVGFGCFFLIR